METSQESKQQADSSKRTTTKYKEDNPQAPDKTEAKSPKKRSRPIDKKKSGKQKVPASNLKKKKKLQLTSDHDNKSK